MAEVVAVLLLRRPQASGTRRRRRACGSRCGLQRRGGVAGMGTARVVLAAGQACRAWAGLQPRASCCAIAAGAVAGVCSGRLAAPTLAAPSLSERLPPRWALTRRLLTCSPARQLELERLRRKAEDEQLRQRHQAAEIAAALAAQRAAAAAPAGGEAGGAGGPADGAVDSQLKRTLKVGLVKTELRRRRVGRCARPVSKLAVPATAAAPAHGRSWGLSERPHVLCLAAGCQLRMRSAGRPAHRNDAPLPLAAPQTGVVGPHGARVRHRRAARHVRRRGHARGGEERERRLVRSHQKGLDCAVERRREGGARALRSVCCHIDQSAHRSVST
jgi:hypothetical protein